MWENHSTVGELQADFTTLIITYVVNLKFILQVFSSDSNDTTVYKNNLFLMIPPPIQIFQRGIGIKYAETFSLPFVIMDLLLLDVTLSKFELFMCNFWQ